MAKSSRGRGRKRSRRQVDWVCNTSTYDLTNPTVLPNNSIVGLPLTIPEVQASYVDPTIGVAFPRSWWPEQDQGQVAYAVRGQVEIIPGEWAIGATFRLMMRIVKKPMSIGSLFTSIEDPQYSLFSDIFANERFLWQSLITHQQNLGSVLEVHNVRWTGVQKLEPDEGLFLYVENQSGITQNVIIRPFLRTLMRANG